MKNQKAFLRQYWQKQPCFLKGGFTDKLDYLTSEQLINLSMDEEIESRIISSPTANSDWQIEHGPFNRAHIDNKPNNRWTLLIQSLDTWNKETRKILSSFNFIPSWRYDDLMVSYATDKGGVGPHVDNYDVFLVQAQGKRHWRVGKMNDIPLFVNPDSVNSGSIESQTIESESGLPHVENFEAMIDVVMEPGDILYVPPNTAHWGESIGDSIGYSVGYRSPQVDSILTSIAESVSENNQLNQFFTDQYRQKPNLSGEIEEELVEWVQKQLKKMANNPALIKSSLGKQLSYSKLGIAELSEPIDLTALTKDCKLQLNNGFKANWVNSKEQIILNIEGESWQFKQIAQPAIEKLVSYEPFPIKLFNFSPDLIDFPDSFTNLISTGYITLIK